MGRILRLLLAFAVVLATPEAWPAAPAKASCPCCADEPAPCPCPPPQAPCAPGGPSQPPALVARPQVPARPARLPGPEPRPWPQDLVTRDARSPLDALIGPPVPPQAPAPPRLERRLAQLQVLRS